MKNRIRKMIGMLFIVITMTAFFSFKTNALSLSYSGSSTSNGTGASASTSGYTISYDAASSNICGYRFSIVSSNGLPKSGTRVLNVYKTDLSIGDTAYFSGQRFISSANVVANKKQLANGTYVYSTTTTQGCDCYSTAAGFYSTIPQSPSSIGDWIKNSSNSYQNLQRIYYYCGSNLANATESDYVLIEPIFWIKLAGVRTAATSTELAIYGASVSGGDAYNGGNGNLYNAGSGTLWNLMNYINREFPNALYVSTNTDVYSAVSVISSGRYTYSQIIQYGYGCSVLTVKNVIPIKKVYIAYHPNGGTTNTSLNQYGWVMLNGTVYFHTMNHGQTSDPYNATTFGMWRTGYTFGGWRVESTGQVLNQDTSYSSTVYADHTDANKTTANTSEVTCYLYAVWIPNKVNIAYHPNGGTTNTSLNQYGWVMLNGTVYFHGMEYGVSDDPYNASTFGMWRTGYTFGGWRVESTSQVLNQDTSYSSTVYADHTDANKTTANTSSVTCYLYAVWIPNKVNIAYHPNGGTTNLSLNAYGFMIYNGSVYPHSINYDVSDDPFDAATFGLTKAGYNFKGWRVRSTGEILNQSTSYSSTTYAQYDDKSKNTANTVTVYSELFAEWEKITYTNTIHHWAWGFNGNGNNNNKQAFHLANTTYSKQYGDVFSLDALNSYVVPNGFYLDKIFGTDYITGSWEHYPFGTTVKQAEKSSRVEYDYYPITYKIAYNLNGGTNNGSNPSSYNVLYGVTLNEPTKENAEFLGWEMKVTKDISMPAKEHNWNYYEIMYSLRPGETYNISIDSASLISGNAENFASLIYDFTLETTLDRKVLPLGDNINYTLTCPEDAAASHDIVLLIYAGENGSTAGNAVTYKNLSVTFEADGINKGCDSAFASSDDFYYQVQRRITGDVVFTAKWKDYEVIELEILPIEPNAPYRLGTEVVTSYWVLNCANFDITPEQCIAAELIVYDGSTNVGGGIKHDIVIPEMDKNLIYFKWEVPEDITSDKLTLTCILMVDYEEYKTISAEYAVTPYAVYSTPDTQYEKYAPSGFRVPSIPENSPGYARWWEYEYDNGNFIKKDYGLGIDVTDTERIYSESNDSLMYSFLIKSGYPFSTYFINSISQVSGYEFPNANAYTDVQYINAKFPEFGYRSGDDYSRTLFKDDYDQWQFRNNGSYGSVHFIPLYYPDGDYYVVLEKSDLWTPAGMIKGEMLSNPLVIEGNAYNDWYIGR